MDPVRSKILKKSAGSLDTNRTSNGMDEPAIRVSGVSKTFKLPREKHNSVKASFVNSLRRKRGYDLQEVLKDVSFEVKKGEFFGIIGRNGSGKSTLLKIIANIYQPSSGSVGANGKLVPFIELGVGFNPELTGRENVYLNGALLGFSQKEIDAKYTDIVKFAELGKFMDQKLKNYSSGMQVRLAFSMAVRAEADILLIDEVLAVGDAAFQRKCFEYFNHLKKTAKTVVFVSHDMDAVRKYCDRGLILEDGKILHHGPTREITEKYIRLFTADPQEQTEKSSDTKRWGDGSWKTESLKVELSDQAINIKQKVKAHKKTAPPVIGIRLRASTGQDVTGTNSQIEQVGIPDLKPGAVLSLEWSLPNILSDGEYYIDSAITANDGITVADWWDEAATFVIKKPRVLPYVIDPGIKLKLEKIK